MADVQLKNGYTPIANDILEHVAKLPLNGTQWRIIAILWRYTYGFSRKSFEIGEGLIAAKCGIHKKQVQREIKQLIDQNIITVVREATFKSARVIGFNKDHDSWQVANKLPPNEKVDDPGSGLVTTPGSGLVTTNKTKYKTKIKTNIYDDFFECMWMLYPKKEGKASVSDSQKKKLYAVGEDQIKRCIERYKRKIEVEHIERKYIKLGSSFFNKGYVDYLVDNYTGPVSTDITDPETYENMSWG